MAARKKSAEESQSPLRAIIAQTYPKAHGEVHQAIEHGLQGMGIEALADFNDKYDVEIATDIVKGAFFRRARTIINAGLQSAGAKKEIAAINAPDSRGVSLAKFLDINTDGDVSARALADALRLSSGEGDAFSLWTTALEAIETQTTPDESASDQGVK